VSDKSVSGIPNSVASCTEYDWHLLPFFVQNMTGTFCPFCLLLFFLLGRWIGCRRIVLFWLGMARERALVGDDLGPGHRRRASIDPLSMESPTLGLARRFECSPQGWLDFTGSTAVVTACHVFQSNPAGYDSAWLELASIANRVFISYQGNLKQ
jgi:hypothetical protein